MYYMIINLSILSRVVGKYLNTTKILRKILKDICIYIEKYIFNVTTYYEIFTGNIFNT